MNKFLLVILFVTSACFALNVVGEVSEKEYIVDDGLPHSPGYLKIPNTHYFRLDNKGGKKIEGFKVYYYIDTYLTQKHDYQYHYRKKLVEGTNELAGGGKVTSDRPSEYVFRIIFDYSKVTIGAGASFPENGKYQTWTLNEVEKRYVVQKLGLEEKQLKNIKLDNYVVESLSGEVLYGKHPKNNSRIGVLGSSVFEMKEYSGANLCSSRGWTEISLDVEDHKNRTRIVNGDKYPASISLTGGHIRFVYCALNYKEIPRVPFDYVVLKLDVNCPEGTYPFRRRHDTEDSDTDNSVNGYGAWPSSVGDNASLEYCFVPADSKSKVKFPFINDFSDFHTGFGVLANYSSPDIAHTEIYIDDEDDDNNNSWNWYGASKDIQKRIRKIMDGSSNTTIHVAKWKGNGGWGLKKESSKNADALIVADNQFKVSDAVLKESRVVAPVIKGLDRSAVAVEMKTAGNVVVSIINVNGAVVAKIASENLQQGIHYIKWNSGIIPNGRYVVIAKQNGVVGAVSAVLK